MTIRRPRTKGKKAVPVRQLFQWPANGAVPADEIDGDEVVIVSEYDPFA
jgi:hypothetical protein